MKLKRLFWLIILILFLSVLHSPPAGQAQANVLLEVQAGFDAYYKTGAWTPIQVTVSNQGADLQARLQVLDDQVGYSTADVLYVYPVDLPAQSRKQFTLYTPLRGQRRLAVELADEAGNVLRFDQVLVQPVKVEDFLIAVVASDPSLLNGMSGLKTFNQDLEDGQTAVAHLNPADLPTMPQAWNGLDLVVFNNVDTAQLSPAQQDALQFWVRRGGQLVIGGGPNAAQTMVGLPPLLPFTNVTIQTLHHPVTSLQSFSSRRLEDRGPYVVAAPVNPTGAIRAKEGNLPLVVQSKVGLGEVIYVALDLGLAPLDRLAGDLRFVSQIAGRLQARPKPVAETVDHNLIRNSLAIIPDQALPTPTTVALYLILYVLAVGPGNYFVLSRLKRRELAWITIPLIILIFSGYSYFSSFRLRGGRPLVRQITVVQAEPGAPLADVASFIGVYSPRRADYTLSIDRPVLVESVSDSYSTLTNQLTVLSSDSTIIKNLRADIGGLPAVVVRSQTALPKVTANVRYNRTTNQIWGSINNQTGQPISHALLVAGDRVLSLETLPAGETQVNQVAQAHNPYDSFYELYRTYYDDAGEEMDANEDPREALRLASRDSAIRAIFNNNQSGSSGQDFNKMYLIGWQEGSFLDVALPDENSDTIRETMLLVRVPFSE